MSRNNLIRVETDTFERGCTCNEHYESDQWFQCTEKDCYVWHCFRNITNYFGLIGDNDAKIITLLSDSNSMFKCTLHGFYEMKIKSLSSDEASNDTQDKQLHVHTRRHWTEQEKSLFIDGLEKYGRDWKLVSKHMGNTRSIPLVKSHAQLHFLRLLKNKKKLPAKVLEPGRGYMLSGKPLNKYSATAITFFRSAQKVPDMDGVISDEEGANKKKRKNRTLSVSSTINTTRKTRNSSFSNRNRKFKFVHKPNIDFKKLYLSKQYILSLHKEHLVDHKRMDGKWCGAKIKMIATQNNKVTIEYIDTKQNVDIKLDNDDNFVPTFAIFNSIARRPNLKHTMETFALGYDGIQVNGKQCKVIGIDNDCGQLKVKNIEINGGTEFWIHPDDERNVRIGNLNAKMEKSNSLGLNSKRKRVNHDVVDLSISSDEDMPVAPPPKRRKVNEKKIKIKHEEKIDPKHSIHAIDLCDTDEEGANLKHTMEKFKREKKMDSIHAIDLCDTDDDGENVKEESNNMGMDLHYTQWTAQEIIIWLTGLEEGRFKQYSQKLLGMWIQEGVKGKDLSDVTQVHLKSWGVTTFRDYVAIHKHIQNLISLHNIEYLLN